MREQAQRTLLILDQFPELAIQAAPTTSKRKSGANTAKSTDANTPSTSLDATPISNIILPSSHPTVTPEEIRYLTSRPRRRGGAHSATGGGIVGGEVPLPPPPAKTRCALTMWPAKFRDPKTGVPYADLGVLRAEEAKTDAASIKAYQLRTYYHGEWRPAYDRWVAMLAGQYASPDGDVVRDAQARLSDMIQTQPVAAELPRLTMPVSLIIGQRDLTAFRANTAPPARRARIRTVPQAAEEAARRIPRASLIRLEGLGHSPQVEAPAIFVRTLRAAITP